MLSAKVDHSVFDEWAVDLRKACEHTWGGDASRAGRVAVRQSQARAGKQRQSQLAERPPTGTCPVSPSVRHEENRPKRQSPALPAASALEARSHVSDVMSFGAGQQGVGEVGYSRLESSRITGSASYAESSLRGRLHTLFC